MKKETQHISSLSDAWQNLDIKERDQYQLILADVDYTLVNFGLGHKKGIEALCEKFGERFAQRFDDLFQIILAGYKIPESQPWDYRKEFSDIICEIKLSTFNQSVQRSLS